jgi:hypothetical protein
MLRLRALLCFPSLLLMHAFVIRALADATYSHGDVRPNLWLELAQLYSIPVGMHDATRETPIGDGSSYSARIELFAVSLTFVRPLAECLGVHT